MRIKKKIFQQQYWEYLIPCLAVISLLISCVIVSSKKYFWNDELLSFYLLNDPSLPHMLVAWSDKFNQAPPLYFMMGWAWDKVFGSTELPLRIFSSVAVCLACILVWMVLRRTYDFWSATVATFSVFCLSLLVLYHNSELRMYGLFTAVCALGLLQYDSLNRQEKTARKSLLINAVIHCAIVLTHLYGVFYSAAILVSFIIRDKRSSVFRKNVYISVLAGWFILVPLAPLIVNQSNNSAKWFYAYKLTETIDLLIPFPRFAWFVLLLLMIAASLHVLQPVKNGKKVTQLLGRQSDPHEISLLILAVAFMLVPIVAWVITVTLKPLLNDRYILPTITISWPILIAFLISRIIPAQEPINVDTGERTRLPRFNLRALVLGSLSLVLILYPIHYAKRFSEYSQKPGANDSSYGYQELPIALEAGHDFLPRFYYSSKPSRYFHILDWETAVNNVTSAYATGDYVHLNAISTHYPFIQSVQSQDFLQKYDRFLVLNEDDQKWFETRIQNNPNYQIKALGTEPGANAPLTMFYVERRS